jgi:hypothetical protein
VGEQTADEARKEHIAKMGEPLGEMYSALWQATATIFVYWKDYVELFGTKPSRIELLNRSAAAFFRMLQEELWEMSLLHIARLTDPPYSFGNKNKPNLSFKALPDLVTGTNAKADVTALVEQAIKSTDFARDWRNRQIAHKDLKLVLSQPTTQLKDASRAQVNAALEAFQAALNGVAHHYLRSETRFDLFARRSGALSLLYLMDTGLTALEERHKRLAAGKPLDGDFAARDL